MTCHIRFGIIVMCLASFMTLVFRLTVIGTKTEEANTASHIEEANVCTHAEEVDAGWSEIVTWIRANGGQVSDKLTLKDTFHSGMKVRGVVSKSLIPESEIVLVVPDNLTIRAEHFPELSNANLDSMCNASNADIKKLKHAIVFAYEFSKLDTSFYAPYLRTLPSLEDYKSYHPQFADAAFLQDLKSFPTVEFILEYNVTLTLLQACWDTWKQKPSCPTQFRSLLWTDVLLGLMHWRTRAFSQGDDSGRLVPIADLLNTESESYRNVDWDGEQEEFVFTSNSDILPGDELFDEYIGGIAMNPAYVAQYGMFLENSNPYGGVKKLPLQDCPTSLQQFAKDALVDFVPGHEEVPRCNQNILTRTQGPLYCSLARTVYEFCSDAWHWGAV